MDNYEIVLNRHIEKLAKFNYAIVSSRTGTDFDVETDSLKVRFMGKDYVVTKSRCAALDCEEDPTKDKILIIDYLLSFGGLDAGEEWIDFRDIPNSMPYDGAFRANVESVLECNVSDILECKEELVRKLDGYDVSAFHNADFAAIFQVFPRVECLVLLFEGDDEIEPGAKLLFSSEAHKFLTTESLAAIAEALTRRLVDQK